MSDTRIKIWISALLVAGCLAIYAQTLAFDFVNYDDPMYVTDNASVKAGLTREGVRWAFLTEDAHYFHPLTWLAHMLDCQVFGLRPWGHHLVNLLLHMANSVLLFLILSAMTARIGPSALAAALFAVHPLHVESVAWVAERKDVLSTFFWLLAMESYRRYAARPRVARMAGVAALFALALMSKPMVVTFPCALMLLDYWPLSRYGENPERSGWLKRFAVLLLEKSPLFVLSAIISIATLLMQARGGVLVEARVLPLSVRLANATVAYAVYLLKTVLPYPLAVYYPLPVAMRPVWQVLGALLILIALSAVVFRYRRRRPYLLVGWLWFLGTFVPVIELVQAGSFAYADRYTYIPLTGLFIMISWALSDAYAGTRRRRRLVQGAAAAAVLALALVAGLQTRHWRNSTALFEHALSVTPGNYVAHTNLGAALAEQGKPAEAMREYAKALAVFPQNAQAYNNLANLLAQQGKLDEAVPNYRSAMRYAPNDPAIPNNLGKVLTAQRRFAEAVPCLETALKIRPGYIEARGNLIYALYAVGRNDEAAQQCLELTRANPDNRDIFLMLGAQTAALGKDEDAVRYYNRAIDIDPQSIDAHNGLGGQLVKLGRIPEALDHYNQALRLNPQLAGVRNNIGSLLRGQGKVDEAAAQYAEALRLDPNYAIAHNNLALCLMDQGRRDPAIGHYHDAIRLDPTYIKARLNLAAALLETGNRTDAIVQYREALKTAPADMETRLGLARLLVEDRKLEEAKSLYRDALKIDPANRDAYFNLGALVAAMGAADEAIGYYNKVLELDPNDARARELLNRARADKAKKGNPSE